MSCASTILAGLAIRGITLQLDGDMLVPRGLRSSFTVELLGRLRQHKPDIVAILQRRSHLSAVARLPSGPDEDHGDVIAELVADLADTYAERIAIVMEAGDVGEVEAHRIAEAEIGAAFVRTFLPGEVAP